jgi:2-hydroxy-6-oxonona-2,4-dienedioate hydrolase
MSDLSALFKSPQGYQAMMAWYDAALERLSVPYQSFTIPTRLGETHLVAVGARDAPPLVLVQGLGGNAMLWEPQLAALARNFRTYALDVVGQTGKSAPTRPSPSDDSYSQWLVNVLDALDIERANIVGLSFGGRLVIRLAAFAPQRMHKVALLSSIGIARLNLGVTRRMLPIGVNLRRPSDAQIRELVQVILAVPGKPMDERLVEAMVLLLKQHRMATNLRQVVNGMRLLFPVPAAELRRVVAPTLLLMGQYEALFRPQAVVARARKLLPNLAAAEIVPDAGHTMNYDRPDFVNARLLEFLLS